MQKKLTITLDEAVYEALHRRVGRGRISRYIEDLVRPKVLGGELGKGYRAMAADTAREAEALEWCNALVGDGTDEAR